MIQQFVPLKRLIEVAPTVRAGRALYPVLSMTMHSGLVEQSQKFKKRVASTDTSAYKVVARNQLVVGFPIDEGVLAFQQRFDAAIVSPAYDVWNLRGSDVEPRYLERFLRSPQALTFYRTKLRGTTARRRTLPDDIFLSLSVPLPTLPEQCRIVAILDKADKVREKRRAALERLNGLTQAMFLDIFGDPVTNPKGFNIGNVECLVRNAKKDIRCGPFGTQLKVDEITSTGVPLFGIENVLDEGFHAATKKFLTDSKANQLRAFDIAPGDVLVTRMGTIGRACVVPATVADGRFSYHLFRIRPDGSHCDPDFLAATIAHSGTFQSQLRLLAHGAVMEGLSTADLKAVKFLLPPVSLQREFAHKVAKVQHLKSVFSSSRARMDEAFTSLQHHAFAGEL